MRQTRFAAATVLAFLVGGVAVAQEKVDNPQFVSWSKFKPGSAITLKMTNDAAGMTSEIVMTTRLVEVRADKLVLEVTATTKAGGMEFKAPPDKQEVPKTIAAPPGGKKEDAAAKKVPGTYEEGTETVKVGGTEFKTKWYKAKSKTEAGEVESKTWMSDDVPGGLVKMESNIKGKVPFTSKMELLEFKKP